MHCWQEFGAAIFEKFGSFAQNVNIELFITGPSDSTPRYNSRKLKTYNHIKTCTKMFIAALFIMAQTGETI